MGMGRPRLPPGEPPHDPSRWAHEVYPDQDTATVTEITDGLPTSSLSSQAVVADMLDSLLLEPGQRVLELGTGSGWNAALLDRRSGPGNTVSVEASPQLAHAASRSLKNAGATVRVETSDGNMGWEAGAPYDRVIATYAVDRIPSPWITQTRPGGRIVTPWGHLGHIALTVAEDGRSAQGWFQGLAQFMPARGTPHRNPGFKKIRTENPHNRNAPSPEPWPPCKRTRTSSSPYVWPTPTSTPPSPQTPTASTPGSTTPPTPGPPSRQPPTAQPSPPRAAPAAWPTNWRRHGRSG